MSDALSDSDTSNTDSPIDTIQLEGDRVPGASTDGSIQSATSSVNERQFKGNVVPGAPASRSVQSTISSTQMKQFKGNMAPGVSANGSTQSASPSAQTRQFKGRMMPSTSTDDNALSTTFFVGTRQFKTNFLLGAALDHSIQNVSTLVEESPFFDQKTQPMASIPRPRNVTPPGALTEKNPYVYQKRGPVVFMPPPGNAYPPLTNQNAYVDQERRPRAFIPPPGNGTPAMGPINSSPYADQKTQPMAFRLHLAGSIRSRNTSLILLVMLAFGLFTPPLIAMSYGINAYVTYMSLHNEAYDGLQHLLNVKTIFTDSKTPSTGYRYLDANKLHLAQNELVAAHDDFQQLQDTINHSASIQAITTFIPQYRSLVTSVGAMGQIGMDVADIGQKLISTGLLLAPKFHGSLLANVQEPLITPDMLVLVRNTINEILPFVRDIQSQSHMVSISALPISADKRDQLVQLIQIIPQAEAALVQAHDLMDAIGWILGVNEPRTFLVQTMDRAELRPTGGFTGQYGELQIHGGRAAPFSLKDISAVEYVDTSLTYGQSAPSAYRSWWPFANWGLRDSNLSADFPTSAQIAINQYKLEVKHQVDGVIIFTPFLIEHILQVIGPVQIPLYNETITAQNLEERLHYYQQDNKGIRREEILQHVEDRDTARKLFTALVAHTLMNQVQHAPLSELLAIVRELPYDLKTKDLQVYVTNPQIEGLLLQYGDAAQIDRSTTHDGLYIVQANLSASKASQYVRTIIHDTVTLDASGGATHVMQLRLVYNQIGPVYGLDAYRDYVRVYVPPSSRYLWGDGFGTGDALCGGPLPACPQRDVYPKDELLCPAGQFQPGAAAPMIDDPYSGSYHPLDTVGPPTNYNSDEPGRAMFGGWVVVPKNCTMIVSLSWYVPRMGKDSYSLLVQRQSGTFTELDLTIQPAPGACAALATQGLHFDDILGIDTSFSAKTFKPGNHAVKDCYPQPGL